MNKFAKFAAPVGAAALALYSTAASAAVDTEVTAALANIGVDGGTVAKTILLAVVLIFAVKFLRKAL